MTRQVVIPRLGIGGRNTDKPTWALRPDELADGSTDGVIYEGALRSRAGHKVYLSDNESLLKKTAATYRAAFALARRIVTYTVKQDPAPTTPIYETDWSIWDSGVDILSFTRADAPLPRAMYRDQLIFCDPEGREPAIFVSGGDPTASRGATGVSETQSLKSIVNHATSFSSPVGAYYQLEDYGVTMMPRIVHVSGLSASLEEMRFSTTVALPSTYIPRLFAFGYPAVSVYSSGTVDVVAASDAATGTGVSWYEAASPGRYFIPGGLLTDSAGIYTNWWFDPTAPTTGTIRVAPDLTNKAYHITARLPFRDVCVHNGALYGAGSAFYPSRVWVAPPGWNPAFPPAALAPFNGQFTSSSLSEHLLDFIDVPSPHDNDPIVAILATDQPRLVLKQNSVYGLYGEPPAIAQRLIHSGDGCIDIRSAVSTQNGAFWAGADGIYRYRFGTFTDLTDGWMKNEWRALTNSGIEYCAIGVDARHLVVSVKTAGAAKRTYLYDLEYARWLPEITNLYPRHMFSANIAGEVQSLLCVDDEKPGKVINLRPALDLSGPPRDETGTGPTMRIVTGDGLAQALGIDGETRAMEVAIHATVTDPAGTSTFGVKAISGGSLRAQDEGQGFNYDSGVNWDTGRFYGPDGCRDLGDITHTTHDQVVRHEFQINRKGRRHQLLIEQETTSATLETAAVGEVVMTFKDSRRNS